MTAFNFSFTRPQGEAKSRLAQEKVPAAVTDFIEAALDGFAEIGAKDQRVAESRVKVTVSGNINSAGSHTHPASYLHIGVELDHDG